MSTADFERGLRVALAERADDVPEDAVRRITTTSFRFRGRKPLRTGGLAPVLIAGTAAAVMVATHFASPAPPSSTDQQARVTPLAYVGRFPRLAVTYLPSGFKVGPLIPLPAPPPGDPPITDQLPLRTFTVNGRCQQLFTVHPARRRAPWARRQGQQVRPRSPCGRPPVRRTRRVGHGHRSDGRPSGRWAARLLAGQPLLVGHAQRNTSGTTPAAATRAGRHPRRRLDQTGRRGSGDQAPPVAREDAGSAYDAEDARCWSDLAGTAVGRRAGLRGSHL